MSYRDYLSQVARLPEEALPFFAAMVFRNAMHMDTAPALHAAERGAPGFDGLALDLEAPWEEGSYHFHFPDGNASVARLLVNRLIPAALPGPLTMESVVPARLDYSRLDQEDRRSGCGSTAPRYECETRGPPSRRAACGWPTCAAARSMKRAPARPSSPATTRSSGTSCPSCRRARRKRSPTR